MNEVLRNAGLFLAHFEAKAIPNDPDILPAASSSGFQILVVFADSGDTDLS